MKSKFALVQEWTDRCFSWSSLSIFGNSYLAKLVALAPIVAIYVKLQEKYLLEAIGFSQAKWLYWSLIAIAFGQLLYFLFADQGIKKYGQDKQRFIMEADATWTTKEFDEAKCKQLLWFLSDKDGQFSLTQSVLDVKSQQEMNNLIADNKWKLSSFNIQNELFQGAGQLKNLLDPKVRFAIGDPSKIAKAINWILMYEPELLQEAKVSGGDSAVQRSDLTRLVSAYVSPTGKDDVKRLALSWDFNRVNFQYRMIRLIVALLYAGGSAYFIWRTIFALLFMMGVPGFELDLE